MHARSCAGFVVQRFSLAGKQPYLRPRDEMALPRPDAARLRSRSLSRRNSASSSRSCESPVWQGLSWRLSLLPRPGWALSFCERWVVPVELRLDKALRHERAKTKRAGRMKLHGCRTKLQDEDTDSG